MSNDAPGTVPAEPAVPPAEPAPPPAPAAGPGRRPLALAIAVLALALAGGALALAWQMRGADSAQLADAGARIAALEAGETERRQGLDAETAQLRDALAAATRAQEATGEALAETRERQVALGRELDSVKARLAAQASAVASVDRALVLAEVEALLFTAGQQLALEGDVPTALAALDAADRQLAAVADLRFAPLREQLAQDRAALAAVPSPDVEGRALYLAAQASRLDELDLRPLDEAPRPQSEAQGEPVTGWRGVLGRVWQDLKSLVEVRSANPADQVLLDPGERFALEQAVRLELTAARLALLNRDSANLRAAATLLVQLLDRFFDPADPGVQDLRAKLAEAAVLELEPPLPSLEQSLALVTALRAADGALDGE